LSAIPAGIFQLLLGLLGRFQHLQSGSLLAWQTGAGMQPQKISITQ
jgi:hypothetical protein